MILMIIKHLFIRDKNTAQLLWSCHVYLRYGRIKPERCREQPDRTSGEIARESCQGHNTISNNQEGSCTNPVLTFMATYRFFLPLTKDQYQLGIKNPGPRKWTKIEASLRISSILRHKIAHAPSVVKVFICFYLESIPLELK